MFRPFRLARGGYLGFDLGATGVRAVEVLGRPGRWRVRSAVARPLPWGAVRDGVVLARDKVAAALAELVAERGWEGRKVFASVGGSRLITRHLRLPPMPRTDLEKAVAFEAERYLPVGLAELSFDFAVLGKERDQEGEKWVVLVAAVPLGIARTYAEIFRAAGLELAALDIVPFALQRVLAASVDRPPSNEEAVAILDIGYSTSHLVILYGGRVEFCRAVSQGWGEARGVVEAMTELAAAGTAAPARLAPPPSVSLEAALAGILQEVRRSVDFFRAQRREAVWGELYLSGGLNRIGEVYSLLEAEVGLAVRPLYPLTEGFSPETGGAVALGTALRLVVS